MTFGLKLSTAICALLLISSTSARLSAGSCPENIEYMTEFDASRYSGMWYEVVRDTSNPYTLNSDCVTKEFSDFHKSSQSMDLYFRGYYHLASAYRGVNGTLYECGQSQQ